MRKVFISLFLLIFSSLAIANQIPNGGFESGLTSWNTFGNVQVVTSYLASDGGTSVNMQPTEGKHFAVITAGQNTSSLSSLPISVEAGKEYSFNWFFDANDYLPFNDYGMFNLILQVGTIMFSDILSSVAEVGNYNLTGWNTYEFTAPTSGNVSFVFSATNALDFALPSVLGIDNLSQKVPEPSTVLLLAIGIFALGLFTRRKTTGELGGFAA